MRRSFKGPFKGPLSSGLLMLQGLGPGHDLCLKDLMYVFVLVPPNPKPKPNFLGVEEGS